MQEAKSVETPIKLNGEKLKLARQQKGYSLDDLSVLCGINRTQIYRYERGENDAMGANLRSLAAALDVSVDYLLDLSDIPQIDQAHKLSIEESALITAYRDGDARLLLKLIAKRVNSLETPET